MDLVKRLAAVVRSLSRTRDRVLVGVDGPDAAGKTTLADRLAEVLDVSTLRASIDGFHQPREIRYRWGDLSAEGYYRDSFDYPALIDKCLRPFHDGAASLRVSSYDYRADLEHQDRGVEVPVRAVLVFDGVFLLREQLRYLWTLSVYVRVSAAETLRRVKVRDMDLFGSVEEMERRYRVRYLPGQALYRKEAAPESAAHVVIGNEQVNAPTIERWEVPVPHADTITSLVSSGGRDSRWHDQVGR